MAHAGAHDLAVILPTRDRWAILARTLSALRSQTVAGFEIVVVVDGRDQRVPDLGDVRVVVQDHAGPGAARNAGAAATDRPLLLFLGDDMVPTPGLVAAHLHRHEREPADEVAVLGLVEWHPEVARSRLARWLDWSGSQFDYRNIVGSDAGFGHFYSSNVSVKRSFFLDAGGFDPDFVFDYEDLDCGYRLGVRGMRLCYEPTALALHLHRHDWASVERRYESRARAERLMAAKHAWFQPFFAERVHRAAAHPPVSRLWPLLVDLVPPSAARLRRLAERRANLWYHQRLAPRFLAAWGDDGEGEPPSAVPSLQLLKTQLVDRALAGRPGVSFADLGGVWAVGAGYTFHALDHHDVARAVLVDTDITDSVRQRAQAHPQLELVEADFRHPDVVKLVGHVDVVFLFDVLLHQVAPDWDEVLAMWAPATKAFAIVNPQLVGEPRSVRLIDLGRDGYLDLVPALPFHEQLFDRLDEDNPRLSRPWRQAHEVWQWGIVDDDLHRVLTDLGFRRAASVNGGNWRDPVQVLERFENHAFLYERDEGGPTASP